MAKYRQVHVHIWKDGWFLDLEPKFKLFFIYLFTNERASISGIYELPKRVMSFESGLTFSEIDDAFKVFEQENKAYLDDGVVWIANLRKYHETRSPKVQKCIADDIAAVKDCQLKDIYIGRYGIDRVSDTLSIPRSSSRDSSSNSSGNGPSPKYGHDPAETPSSEFYEKRNRMMCAIDGATKDKLVFGTESEERFKRVAETFLADGDTPEMLAGFAGFWKKKTDKPYDHKPWLKSLVDNWEEYKISRNKIAAIPADWGKNALSLE
jgi:hypothetical protein